MNSWDKVKFNGSEMDVVKLNGAVVWRGVSHARVAYIESTGGQYIDTGIQYGQNIRVECGIDILTNTSNTALFGAKSGAETYGILYYDGSNKINVFKGGTSAVLTARGVGVNDIVYNDGSHKVKVNGAEIANLTCAFTQSGSNIYIHAVNNGSGSPLFPKKTRTSYFKIIDNNTNEVLRDFEPVIKADIACLYDNISRTYFMNQGTGVFTAGPEI